MGTSLKNKFRKLLTVALAVCMVFGMTLHTGMSTVQAADSTSWNFKNTGFKSLGTITSNVTVSGLGLIATSTKTMSVIADAQTVSGTSYTHALALGGSGSKSYRAVKVPVSSDATIKVVLKSSGSTARTLVVADANGKQLGTMNANVAAAQASYNFIPQTAASIFIKYRWTTGERRQEALPAAHHQEALPQAQPLLQETRLPLKMAAQHLPRL